MTQLFNIYCDESCHLEHDASKVMVLGAAWCPAEKVREIAMRLREIKRKHGLGADFELKWTKVGPAKLPFYLDVLDYFFDDDDLHFRALVVPDKGKLDHEAHNQDHDTFYYKMFFDLLKVLFNPKAHCLKTRIEQVLQRMVTQNPKRIDFYKRFQAIIEAYNRDKDRATIEKTFEELVKLVDSLSEEENRALRENLSEEHLAVFDLLVKEDLKPKERDRIKDLAKGLLDELKAQIESLDQWAEKASTKSQVSTFIHDYLFDEQRGLPDAYAIEEVEVLSDQVFDFVYRHYGRATDGAFGAA